MAGRRPMEELSVNMPMGEGRQRKEEARERALKDRLAGYKKAREDLTESLQRSESSENLVDIFRELNLHARNEENMLYHIDGVYFVMALPTALTLWFLRVANSCSRSGNLLALKYMTLTFLHCSPQIGQNIPQQQMPLLQE
eukprot:756028-Hanusia_phi.AAC.1